MSTRTAEQETAFDRRLIVPLVMGAILNPVNSSMIAVALIPIGAAFGAPPAQTAWLVSALYLATAVGQPVVGRLVDLHGPRALYLVGTALVGAAGVIGTLAPAFWMLIVARVLLGFGTCAGYPAAMFLIRSEAERTGRDSPASVLTVLAVSTQTVTVIGPSLGGLLIGAGDWRAVFAVNVPLALACLLLGALRLPRMSRQRDRGPATGLDLPGMALFAAMLTALLLFLMDLTLWYLPVLTVLCGLGLVVRELRVPEPFVDLRVLGHSPALLATFGRTLLMFVVSYAFLYGFTQWLEDGRGLSPSGAGLVLLPTFLIAIVVSTVTGRNPRVRMKLLVGSAAQVLGCALILLLHAQSPLWMLLAAGAVLGVPQGLNNLANQNALYHQADPERMGSSAGLQRTFMYLGAMVASAANGVFFPDRADTAGLHGLGLFMVVVAAAFFVLTVADRSLRHIGHPASGPG